jgi:hypothetical protein
LLGEEFLDGCLAQASLWAWEPFLPPEFPSHDTITANHPGAASVDLRTSSHEGKDEHGPGSHRHHQRADTSNTLAGQGKPQLPAIVGTPYTTRTEPATGGRGIFPPVYGVTDEPDANATTNASSGRPNLVPPPPEPLPSYRPPSVAGFGRAAQLRRPHPLRHLLSGNKVSLTTRQNRVPSRNGGRSQWCPCPAASPRALNPPIPPSSLPCECNHVSRPLRGTSTASVQRWQTDS